MSLILWFMLLSSGGALCASVWKRQYEEVLPITCASIVVALFFSGIAGMLKIGMALVCALAIGIYIYTVCYIVRKKSFDEFLKNFFTPGFFVFLFLFLLACFLDVGKMAYSWDEFSHWVDSVKVMLFYDDFGTYPGAEAAFPNYPPAMPLFQYSLQKLYIWTNSSDFSEWKVYVAFQVFVFSFMIPCFRFCWKKPFRMVFSVVVIFLSPLVFYNNFYCTVYIDPVLGILSGTGIATIFLNKERNLLYSLRIWLICMMLVLLKDAGLLFALLLSIFYVADLTFGYGSENTRRKYLCILISFLAVMLPKCFWSYHLKARNAQVVFGSINVKMLFDVIANRDTSWRKTVLDNYCKVLSDTRGGV